MIQKGISLNGILLNHVQRSGYSDTCVKFLRMMVFIGNKIFKIVMISAVMTLK